MPKKSGSTRIRPSAQEMLDFLCLIMDWPYTAYISGDGSSRSASSKWMLSYGDKSGGSAGKVHNGCVYAPSRDQVIMKAMRLMEAQNRADAMIAEAMK